MSEKTKKAKYRASKLADRVEVLFDALPAAHKKSDVLIFGYEAAGVKPAVAASRIDYYHRAAALFGGKKAAS